VRYQQRCGIRAGFGDLPIPVSKLDGCIVVSGDHALEPESPICLAHWGIPAEAFTDLQHPLERFGHPRTDTFTEYPYLAKRRVQSLLQLRIALRLRAECLQRSLEILAVHLHEREV